VGLHFGEAPGGKGVDLVELHTQAQLSYQLCLRFALHSSKYSALCHDTSMGCIALQCCALDALTHRGFAMFTPQLIVQALVQPTGSASSGPSHHHSKDVKSRFWIPALLIGLVFRSNSAIQPGC
jgi:hypothetical protein